MDDDGGDDRMMIYMEMLQETGVPVKLPPTPPPKRILLEESIECCSEPELVNGPRDENAYCQNCGLCVRNPFYQVDYKRLKNSMMVKKKRFYNPLTHFKEHLRRYMGQRFTNIPETVIENTKCVDIKNPQAFTLMKEQLKKLGKPKLYKEIFLLIYMHGGDKPDISPEQYYKCIEDFKTIQHYFLKDRAGWDRHSMPSNYMILKFILERNGHEPYYEIPALKNDKCRFQVYDIYFYLEKLLNSTEKSNLNFGN